MEKLNLIIDFLGEHWAMVSAVVLWVAQRLIKTQKNYDLLEMALKFIGEKVIPNRVEKPVEKDPAQTELAFDPKTEKKRNVRKDGGKLAILLCVLLFPLLGYSQLNGNFKSVRFVNVLDSTTVLPVNGSIYYNEQSNKFRVYENNVWKDLVPNVGSLIGVENGLSETGNIVRLGGQLNQSTIIDISDDSFSLIMPDDFTSGEFNFNQTAFAGGQLINTVVSDATSYSGFSWFGGTLNLESYVSGVLTNGISFNATTGDAILTLGGTTGSANQVLTTDGTNISWQNPSSSLTNTQIGFGSGTNTLTGEPAFNYTATSNTMTVGTVILSNSTANQIVYPNGSNVLSGEAAFTYDDTFNDLILDQSSSNIVLGPTSGRATIGPGGVTTSSNSGGNSWSVQASSGSGSGINGSNISNTTGAGGGGNSNGGNFNITLGAGTGTGHGGYLIVTGLPTSSAGLPSGAIWSNAGVLTIVP